MKRKFNTTRASRDGHEFHEAWTARKALQLFWPDSDLIGIAVEGLSPNDQSNASNTTVEIADIALYFGPSPSFEHCTRNTITQFKYSIANEDKHFRASNAKKTITKFAKTYSDYKNRYGAQAVSERLDFQIITNQPIYKPLIKAVEAITNGVFRTGDIKRQADQFIAAADLEGKPLAEFASKVSFIGRSGSLNANKEILENLLVDWSSTNDPIAHVRLGHLKDLVREKAGYAGTNKNLITRTDILAVLRVSDADDLLPCKPQIIDVGTVLEREQFSEVLEQINTATRPVLVHAAGGVGKTVFLASLERQLKEIGEVVFFDCFGGGAYRSLEDARHQPKQGFIHIANTLAFRGLCDPMLPETSDQQILMRTFRRRLEQCVNTISRVTPGRMLVILIDAIDNAEIVARQRSEDAFPVKLLESLDTKSIDGVKIVVSCRSHRKPTTYAKCNAYELRPFDIDETRTFLRDRLSGVTEAEVNVAQARSGGNPRVLDYLLRSSRSLLDDSEINQSFELEELIQKRIDNALATVIERGSEQDKINDFLAGLAVLPPPVPFDEYASALGIELSAVQSFASDLVPLVERTNQGLTFKDEPTETLVRERYASFKESLKRVAENLLGRQNQSVYAARSLPGLLYELDDGESLFSLAFDDRIPASVTSTVGKRNIRYARLKAATLHAAITMDNDRLVRLLVELSTIAAVDQRGARYLLENPDLAVALNDADAMRRLFETRSGWPGARHARLSIANTLAGDVEEAYRNVRAAHEWVEHELRNKEEKQPEDSYKRLDIAALPFSMIMSGHVKSAAQYLRQWYDWYAFEVCEHLFDILHHAQLIRAQSEQQFTSFVNSLTALGHIAAALSFSKLSKPITKDLIQKLSRRCRREIKLLRSGAFTRIYNYEIEDGLRKSSALALIHGLKSEAVTISLRARHDRPGIRSFRDSFRSDDIFRFIFRVALVAAAKGIDIHEKELLPKDLVPICKRIPKRITGEAFRDKAKHRLSKIPRRPCASDPKSTHQHVMTYGENQRADHFLNFRLEPLLSLTKALSSALSASPHQINKRFVELVKTWEKSRKKKDSYSTDDYDSFFQFLGFEVALFVIWTRDELQEASVRCFLTAVHAYNVGAANIIRIIAILARRPVLQTFAGEQAVKASILIQDEDEVTYRADLYASLSRAMLPASREQASHYFREGLEQMDSIGSGDYEFINELLLFASTINGDELDERDFHTLSNIAELNLGDEPERFNWGAYGGGIANIAGLRGLAKLSRWEDRSRISLDYTLLPYLIGLLKQRKVTPRDAIALNRLANPVENFYSSTKEFAEAVREQSGPEPEVITALIEQYRDNNPGLWLESTTTQLSVLADEALGSSSDLVSLLAESSAHHSLIRDTLNEHQNYRGPPDTQTLLTINQLDQSNQQALERIMANTDPVDESSLVEAITDFNKLEQIFNLKDGFFADLREKVSYSKRSDYLRHICELEHLFYYWKIAELKQAKDAWTSSSAGLEEVFKSLAVPLMNIHASDLIIDDRVSNSDIKEISEFTGVPMAELVIELIKVFARLGSSIPSVAWLTFASIICSQASEGQGQLALSRLLASDATKLAKNVPDGVWEHGLYPDSDITQVAAGLIWCALGSPEALRRWRAAHCMRDLARFGNWSVIEAIVEKFSTTTAGPFQAAELKFYYMHARLWLLIALARLALDYPNRITEYKDNLLAIIFDSKQPHVLMRHFAARALLDCVDAGELKLPDKTLRNIRCVNGSPNFSSHQSAKQCSGFYDGRPKGVPEPPFRFYLEYNFEKYIVTKLSQIFGKRCWEVTDKISEIVHAIEPDIKSMDELGGRDTRYGLTSPHVMTARSHGYGQQLGYHALFLVAAQLLASFPVTDDYDWRYEDPWHEWFRQYILTRKDGLWLSDGTDKTPLNSQEILLEPGTKGLTVTGDQAKILSLVGISGDRLGEELIVDGGWYSADNIRVEVSSALVSSKQSPQLARKLISEDPMTVWLPVYHDSEEDREYQSSEKKSYVPWIVRPSRQSRLDEYDPYGVSVANERPRLASKYTRQCNLKCSDKFGREWHNYCGTLCLHTQAWGPDKEDREGGLRLFCRRTILKKILATHSQHLLVLIKLERYENQIQGESCYTHSVGVASISESLQVSYFKGQVNHPHKLRY